MSSRVLVVDDEVDVPTLFRQRFRRDIREGRFVLDFAQSGDEALRKITQGEMPLVLLLSDINMPGMNGLDLLSACTSTHPELPVVMISAYGDDDTRAAALQRGAVGLLSKPLDFALLRSEIETRVG